MDGAHTIKIHRRRNEKKLENCRHIKNYVESVVNDSIKRLGKTMMMMTSSSSSSSMARENKINDSIDGWTWQNGAPVLLNGSTISGKWFASKLRGSFVWNCRKDCFGAENKPTMNFAWTIASFVECDDEWRGRVRSKCNHLFGMKC